MTKQLAGPRLIAPRPSFPGRLGVSLPTRESDLQREKLWEPPLLRRNRTQVKAACLSCRRGKTKCDGQRSPCQRCVEKGLSCVYDIEPDISHFMSLRRKHRALQTEVNQLHAVIEYIRTRPDMDASETFRQIRAFREPLDVAESLSTASAFEARSRTIEHGTAQ